MINFTEFISIFLMYLLIQQLIIIIGMQYAQPAGLWRGKGARPACKDLLTINIAAELLPVASINHELKLKAGLRKTFWLCPPPPSPCMLWQHAHYTLTLQGIMWGLITQPVNGLFCGASKFNSMYSSLKQKYIICPLTAWEWYVLTYYKTLTYYMYLHTIIYLKEFIEPSSYSECHYIFYTILLIINQSGIYHSLR